MPDTQRKSPRNTARPSTGRKPHKAVPAIRLLQQLSITSTRLPFACTSPRYPTCSLQGGHQGPRFREAGDSSGGGGFIRGPGSRGGGIYQPNQTEVTAAPPPLLMSAPAIQAWWKSSVCTVARVWKRECLGVSYRPSHRSMPPMKVIKRLFRVSSPMLALAAGLAPLAGLLWPGLRRRTCSSLFLVQARLPGPPLGLPVTIKDFKSSLFFSKGGIHCTTFGDQIGFAGCTGDWE